VIVLDRGRIAAQEHIEAPRGQRGEVGRALRQRLLGYLGCDTGDAEELAAVDVGASILRFPAASGATS
ncbi:MAG TPA: hypothetical protein VN222_01470, partial [Novosphingobium sp.]|nr:hypothetical protein [Novosphingobium sp.]